jgi:PAS domain S-box-containing protein
MSEQLADSQEKYAAVFDHSPLPICIYALGDFGILDVNEAARRLYGYAKDELMGRDVRQLLHPDELTRFERAPCRVREGLQQGPIWRHVTKDGREIHVRVSTHLMEFEGMKAQMVLAQDVTQYRLTARRARDAERKLRTALTQTIQVLLSASEQRDAYTAGHQQRVCDITVRIAREIGLSAEQIDGLRFASMIHDIGKLGIPAELLALPRKLKPEEYALVRMHSQIGYDILKDMDYPWPIQDLVLQHHERLDGSGYPNQLRGPEICLEARVIAVADAVEAMSSHRPYRAGMGLQLALEEVSAEAGTRYDADVVDACWAIHKSGELQPLLVRSS